MRKLTIWLFLTICLILTIQSVSAITMDNLMYITSQFTGQPDWIRTGNWSGENITADYFFGDGSLLDNTGNASWNETRFAPLFDIHIFLNRSQDVTFGSVVNVEGILYANAMGTGLDVLNSATIGNFLEVMDDLTVGGELEVAGTTNLSGNVTMEKDFDLTGYGFIGKDLTVTGNITAERVSGYLDNFTEQLNENRSKDVTFGITSNVRFKAPSFFEQKVSFLLTTVDGGDIVAKFDDGLQMCLDPSDANNNFIITSQSNCQRDHDHTPNSVNPTLFIHSATNPNTENDEWISLTHDTTNAVIDWGSGSLNLSGNTTLDEHILFSDDDEGLQFYSGANEMLNIRRFSAGNPTFTVFDAASRMYFNIGATNLFHARAGTFIHSTSVFMVDNLKSVYGTGNNAEVYYNGSDQIIDPDLVGSGSVWIGATGDDDIYFNDGKAFGNLNVTGNTTMNQGLIVNENGDSNDVRMESKDNTHQFFVDGSNNCIGFDTSSCQSEAFSFGQVNNYIRRVSGKGLYIIQAESSGNYMFMSGVGHTEISIDGNNNENTREFIVSKDSLVAGEGTVLFNITEKGNAKLPLGNLTSENVFVPQYAFAHTNRTQPVLGANIWTNMTFNQEATKVKFGITHTFDDNTNHTFTINEDGVYNLEFDFDMIDFSASATIIDMAGRVIFSNGTEIDGSAFETDITRVQVETELSHSSLARLRSGDVIIFQFIADDADVSVSTHGTFGTHPDSATIIIEKVANI